jgi:hypothetical protein
MEKEVRIWFDAEGDYLEVMFGDKQGYMTPSDNDAVMEMVDMEGNILGFSVMAVSNLAKDHPLAATLISKVA